MQFFYEITQSLNKLWAGTIEVCERKVCLELHKVCSTLQDTVGFLIQEKIITSYIIFRFPASISIFDFK